MSTASTGPRCPLVHDPGCCFYLVLFLHVCMAEADLFCGRLCFFFFALAFSAWCFFPPCAFSIAAFPPRRISSVNTCACRELSFKKGDAVNIIRQIDTNWYEGEFRGRVGIFPMSYVEVGAPGCYTCVNLASQLKVVSSLPPFFSSHTSRRCLPQRSSSRSVLPPQRRSERSERLWLATTSTLTPTWSCLSER